MRQRIGPHLGDAPWETKDIPWDPLRRHLRRKWKNRPSAPG